MQLAADPDGGFLMTANTPTHTLLGLPTHLPADESDALLAPSPGCAHERGSDGFFNFDKLFQPAGLDLLQQ